MRLSRCVEVRTRAQLWNNVCRPARTTGRAQHSVRAGPLRIQGAVCMNVGLTRAVGTGTIGRTFFGAHSSRISLPLSGMLHCVATLNRRGLSYYSEVDVRIVEGIIPDTRRLCSRDLVGSSKSAEAQHPECSSGIAHAHVVLQCSRPLCVVTAAVKDVAPGRCCVPCITNRLTDPIRKASAWHHEVMRTLGGLSFHKVPSPLGQE